MTVLLRSVIEQDFELEAQRLGPLSNLARHGKLRHFLPLLERDALILDAGCGDNWFKREAAKLGWSNVVSLDLAPPADLVGNIFEWRSLGLEEHSFDAIVAFEVVEHGRFSDPLHELLKPTGFLFVTTPIPRVDPLLKVLERMRLLQRRTSPHINLMDVRNLPRFQVVDRRVKAGVSQWAVLTPSPQEPDSDELALAQLGNSAWEG